MNGITAWFAKHPTAFWGLKTVFYLVIITIGVLYARNFVRKVFDPTGKDHKKKTVYPIFRDIVIGFIYFLAFIVILEVFGVSTTPVWTILSAVSVAIGFGAQLVMRDVFSGILILMEGQYAIGDIVEINGDTGEVESITLRTTGLRDGVNGAVYIISNGEIRTVTNLTKDYMYAVVDLPIPYDINLDKVLDLVKDIAKKYPNNDNLLDEVSVQGVREFSTRNIVIRVSCKTKAGQNWSVERDLRRFFKNELEANGVQMPYVKTAPSESEQTPA